MMLVYPCSVIGIVAGLPAAKPILVMDSLFHSYQMISVRKDDRVNHLNRK